MKYQVSVDLDVCDSFGACVAAEPAVFDLTDDDELVLLAHEVDETQRAGVEEAVLRCPKRAIALKRL
jgi:ferredoxin